MISITTILLVLFGVGFFFLLAYVAGKWVFSVDQEVVKVRRALGSIAAALKTRGMSKIPAFLLDLSVDDWKGMAEKVKAFAALCDQGEEAILKEFDQAADSVIKSRMLTPEGRAFIAALLQDAAQATDPAVTKAVAVGLTTVAATVVPATAPAVAVAAAL